MSNFNLNLESFESFNSFDSFNSLKLPIPEIVTKYPPEKQKEIYDYFCEMDSHHQKAYKIAFHHLGSSFNICKSNGFIDWKKSRK